MSIQISNESSNPKYVDGQKIKNDFHGIICKTSAVLFKLTAVVITSVLSIAIVLMGIIWVFEKGPSESLTSAFCRSVRETSAVRWLSTIYLSDEELQKYLTEKTESIKTERVDASFIHIDEKRDDDDDESVQLIDITMGTAKGKLLIVKDPKSVRLGTSDNFGILPGLQLTELVAKYGGIAGINAGGFNDENGYGDGGKPQGLVIDDGVITWGNPYNLYSVIGIDYDGILHVETVTGLTAINEGIRWGVSFVTHDGQASSLIINGKIQTWNMGSGVNPRTALGQRKDGALLLLVLDGRSINTLGATMEDICNVMLEYGAWNVGNLDGGSSSVMVYDGEIVNHCASVTGPRMIPTAFIVLDGGNEID